MKSKIKNAKVVKIDSFLLKEVEEFIKKAENKFRFANKKQFIDLAVCEFLKKELSSKKIKKAEK